MATRLATQHGDELDPSPNPIDTTGLCLLSLDGGGVRGLSSLYILKGFMARLNHQRQSDGLPREMLMMATLVLKRWLSSCAKVS
jgi:hypothetical protein